MYSITYTDSLGNVADIYSPTSEQHYVRAATAHLAVNEAGTLKFTLDNDHPNILAIQRMSGAVELKEGAVTKFRGRIVNDKTDFNLSHSIEAEGMLATTNDSIIPPFRFPDDFLDDADYIAAYESGNVVAFFLGWLLSLHNAQMTTADRLLYAGRVTVCDPNNYITRSSEDYTTTWNTLKSKLFDSSLGGYLVPRYEVDGTYIDYVYADGTDGFNSQTIEYAKNLLNLSNEVNGEEMYTAVLPIGNEGIMLGEGEYGVLPSDYVAEGDIIYDVQKVAQYGRITKIIKFDDVNIVTNLAVKAVEALARSAMPETLTCSACDFRWVDGEEAFEIGKAVDFISPQHGFNATLPLLEMDIDILEPGTASITFSTTRNTLTSSLVDDADKPAIIAASTEYYVSSSDVSIIDGEWTEMYPPDLGGGYLWSRNRYEYDNGAIEYSAEICVSRTMQTAVSQQINTALTPYSEHFTFDPSGGMRIKAKDADGNDVSIYLELKHNGLQIINSGAPSLWFTEKGGHMDKLSVKGIYLGNSIVQEEQDGRVSIKAIQGGGS